MPRNLLEQQLDKLEYKAKWFWAERSGYVLAIIGAYLVGRFGLPF